jgi:hypothetical protein
LEAVCDELGIGGNGEYSGDNEAHLGRIYMFYLEAFGGKYVPCAVLFDLEPGVTDAARASPLGELLRPENLVNQNVGAGNNWSMAHYPRASHEFCLIPCIVAAFVSPTPGHVPRFVVCGARSCSLCS